MLRYIARRVLLSLPTLLAISVLLFAVLALAPGDPLGEFALDPAITPEVRAHIRASFGLDQPLHVRYVRWLTAFVRGDMGYSFSSHSPVRTLIAQRLGPTLWIVGMGYALSLLLALPCGLFAALRPHALFDRLVNALALPGYALPTFLTAMLLILLFSIKLRWLPMVYQSTLHARDLPSTAALLRQSLLPVLVLALFQTAVLLRFVRAAALEQVRQDYVMAARARGMRDSQILVRHIARNALLPVVTLVALDLPGIFTGAMVVEQMFRVPGIGSLLIAAIQSSDTPVVMAITFLSAILVVGCNLVADLLYALLDPRVRLT